LGFLIDLTNLDDLGLPGQLLAQIGKISGGTVPVITEFLQAQGIPDTQISDLSQGRNTLTSAQELMTLSLIPKLSQSAIKIENVRMGVNYGLNKVRFTSPVPVGSKLRGHMKLLNAVPIDGNGMQFTWEMSIEREGSEKPACIAESLARYYV
jgi:hypothetical protein